MLNTFPISCQSSNIPAVDKKAAVNKVQPVACAIGLGQNLPVVVLFVFPVRCVQEYYTFDAILRTPKLVLCVGKKNNLCSLGTMLLDGETLAKTRHGPWLTCFTRIPPRDVPTNAIGL